MKVPKVDIPLQVILKPGSKARFTGEVLLKDVVFPDVKNKEDKLDGNPVKD